MGSARSGCRDRTDILNGKITEHPVDLEDLLDKGVEEGLLELLDLMLSDDPDLRPDIDEVKDYFDQLV